MRVGVVLGRGVFFGGGAGGDRADRFFFLPLKQ